MGSSCDTMAQAKIQAEVTAKAMIRSQHEKRLANLGQQSLGIYASFSCDNMHRDGRFEMEYRYGSHTVFQIE